MSHNEFAINRWVNFISLYDLNPFTFLRLVLWPRICCILVNLPCTLEKNVCCCFRGVGGCSSEVKLVGSMVQIFCILSFFCLQVLFRFVFNPYLRMFFPLLFSLKLYPFLLHVLWISVKCIKCQGLLFPPLSLVIFFALQSTLYDINISNLTFFRPELCLLI